jgi:hypothetical protein
MRNPNVNLDLAKQLADNAMQIQALRFSLERTQFGTEQSVILQSAIDPLIEERERLVETGFS